MRKLKVAIIGTQGIPASYGGFETLAEMLVRKKDNQEIEYTIFCSSKDLKTSEKEVDGAHLKYIPLSANGTSSLPYDIISMIRSICGYDTILILGVSGCIFLPVLRLFTRAKIIVNIDGLEHRRDKWGKWVRKFLLFSEKMAVRFAHAVISDNMGIWRYVKETYNAPSTLIAYGGDQVIREISENKEKEVLQKYDLLDKEYSLSICRIEPENNCHVTLEAFRKSGRHLVFIGNWNKNEYARNLAQKYSVYNNISIVNAIYDQDTLYAIRKNAGLYVHGHSAGGSNPSLIEAMFLGQNILAFDVEYNRETLHGLGEYFSTSDELSEKLKTAFHKNEMIRTDAFENYTWKTIVKKYEALYY